jgi:GT2 family glycosyltransferase
MKMSIVTPAHNNPEQVSKLLRSIYPEKVNDRDLEVIIVDDGSSDDSIRRIVEKNNPATYIRLNENRGPAAARNIGAKLAKNDILLFLDSDVVLNRDTLSKITEKFNKDSPVKILCGEYDFEPENRSFFTRFKAIMARSWIPGGNTITVFVARLGAIRKDIFNKLGGFDEGIKTASSEEWEFGRRLINAGFTINYDPAITVKHHFPTFKRQMILFFHRSFMWLHVFRKSGKFDNTCTTPIQAVAQICGFLAVFFMIISVFRISAIFMSLFFLLLFITMNIRFFKLAFMREGLIFTLLSLPPALILSCSIVFGGLWAACRLFYSGLTGRS